MEPTPPELGTLDRQNVVSIETTPPSPARRIITETLQTVALALFLFLIINSISARIRVDGSSMEPSFQDGNYVIVNKIAYGDGDLERGDVIVFPYPLNREEDFIKRIIGLPGDHISILRGDVFINGSRINEDYLLTDSRGDMEELIVPQGTVFVMGDNRNDSSDSRIWGPLSIEEIIGKAIFRYWPLPAMGPIQHPDIAPDAPTSHILDRPWSAG